MTSYQRYAVLCGIVLLIAGLSVKTLAADYGLPRVKPEKVGMSSSRLARIAPAMQPFIDRGDVPGLLTVVARHGKVVHVKAQGYANVEEKIPLAPDTIFRLYSMTKPITGVATMMMYEEGHFFLDDPIADYLPEFKDMKVWTKDGIVAADKPITIRHLLTHTAGFTYDSLQAGTPLEEIYKSVPNEVMRRTEGVSLAEHVKQVAELPLVAQPGTEWNYGESMSVLARLVEITSGQSFGDFLRQRIFKPLNMPDTDYTVAAANRHRLARLYEQQPNTGFAPTDGYGGDYTIPATIAGGNAGLAGTAADYLRFAQMLLNGGALDGVRLLSPTSVRLIMSDHLGPEFGDTPLRSLVHPMTTVPGLGFGFCGLVVRDALAVGSAGSNGEYSWGGWANTDFWIDPKQDLVALVFTQVIPKGRHLTTRARMHQMTYQALIKP